MNLMAQEAVSSADQSRAGRTVPYADAMPESWPFARGPLLVPGGARSWPAWNAVRSGRFAADNEDVMLEARQSGSSEVWRVSLPEYLRYCEDPGEDTDPWYAKQWTISDRLASFVDVPQPTAFRSWFDHLPERIRPSWNWVFVGPRDSRSPLHVDVMCSSAWNGLITGQKLWRILSPAASAAAGLIEPQLLETLGEAELETYELTIVQEPGDLLVVPSLWGHEVVNSQPSVAVNGNFVNGDNVRAVERYLEIRGRASWLNALCAIRSALAERGGV